MLRTENRRGSTCKSTPAQGARGGPPAPLPRPPGDPDAAGRIEIVSNLARVSAETAPPETATEAPAEPEAAPAEKPKKPRSRAKKKTDDAPAAEAKTKEEAKK